MKIPSVQMEAYAYVLPEERIALRPSAVRGDSKLLIYEHGQIRSTHFSAIVDELGPGDVLVFNNSKVFPARMVFKKETGARIEVFALQPLGPVRCVGAQCEQVWEVLVGNVKRWPLGSTLRYAVDDVHLEVTYVDKVGDHARVVYRWYGGGDLIELLERIAELPLPPYLNRKAEREDYERYQTVYANAKGSVAAPTAGLHFTDELLEKLRAKGVHLAYVTLHVGAGTFKPVKSKDISGHAMHTEQYMVPRDTLQALEGAKRVIGVGTTTLRVLESMYLLGQADSLAEYPFTPQWAGFNTAIRYERSEVWRRLQVMLHGNTLRGSTAICLCPGYSIGSIDGLVTNFHQPESTLILLVAAWLGADWRRVYDYALVHGFRFLSYGDSSLLWGDNSVR